MFSYTGMPHALTSCVLRKIGVARLKRAQKSGSIRIFLYFLVYVNNMYHVFLGTFTLFGATYPF